MTFNLKNSCMYQLFEHKTDILQICKEFLRRHQLAFFSYLCCYRDKKSYVLSTHPEVYQYLLQAELPLTAPVSSELLHNKRIYCMVPDPSTYGEVMHNVAIRFNLYYPLDYILRGDDYYEMFCYGASNNDFNKINYYLNNLSEFEHFIKVFKEKTGNIVKKMSDNPIILPESMFDPVRHLIMTNPKIARDSNKKTRDKNEYSTRINGMNIVLTKREYDCLNCLLQGLTAQETAENLFLSRRTVESYLEIIKQKTFSRNKIDLVAKTRNAVFLT